VIPGISLKKIFSLILLILLLVSVILFAIGTIMSLGNLSIVTNPRVIIVPIVFAAVYFLLMIKRKEKSIEKKELLDIIQSIPDEEISIQKIAKRYMPNHKFGEDKEKDNYIKKEVKTQIIDLLWEGHLQTHKYVIDKKSLVRIESKNTLE